MLLTHQEAIKITKGKTNNTWSATGVSINSKTINQGNLFIALKGKNFNGHSFIHEAFKNGASVAIVDKSINSKEYEKYPLLIVEDTYQALLDIAKNNRKNYKGKIIAVTGSVGKTTTKEMLKLALKNLVPVYASIGNFNNHIGMPLCLANIDNESEVAIFELGMNHPKEISFLSNILQPNYAIITEISSSHSAFFKSLDDIFLSKMEIIDGLKHPKILFFNINNPFFFKAKQKTKEMDIKIFGFGKFGTIFDGQDKTFNKLNNEASNKLHNKVLNTDSSEQSNHLSHNIHKNLISNAKSYISLNNAILCSKNDFLLLHREVVTKIINKQIQFSQKLLTKIGDFTYSYNLPTLPLHKAVLSTLVLGIVYLLKYDIKKAIDNLSEYTDINGRGNFSFISLDHQNSGFYLLDDSYNASPLSMKKSILALKDINLPNSKILVLGEMLELSNEIFEHQNLKKYILDVKPKAVFAMGNNMKYLIDILPSYIDKFFYLNEKNLLHKLISYLQNNDIVLIKGSLGSKVYKIAEELYNLKVNNYK